MAEENGEVKMAAVRHCSIKSEGSGGESLGKANTTGTLAWILLQTPLFMCLFLHLLLLPLVNLAVCLKRWAQHDFGYA